MVNSFQLYVYCTDFKESQLLNTVHIGVQLIVGWLLARALESDLAGSNPCFVLQGHATLGWLIFLISSFLICHTEIESHRVST